MGKPRAKALNEALRGTKPGPHKDKREDAEREFNNQRVRELIEELRSRRAKGEVGVD